MGRWPEWGGMGGSVVTTAGLTDERETSAARVRVTRRALFARDLSVWGFELMWVGSQEKPSPGEFRGDSAHPELGLLNALAELGVKPLVADKTALISVTSDTLLG